MNGERRILIGIYATLAVLLLVWAVCDWVAWR
jgi:hypothetical protein